MQGIKKKVASYGGNPISGKGSVFSAKERRYTGTNKRLKCVLVWTVLTKGGAKT